MSQTLQIMKMGEQIADLEDQITKWREDYICLENLKDNQIKELEEQINEWKTKFENLQKYLDTQNCYRECAETWQKNKELQEEINEWKENAECSLKEQKMLQEELDYAKNNCLFSDCDRVARLEKQIEKMKSDSKTAYIKGIRAMANALKEFDRTEGAWTDYFEHTVDKVLKNLLKELSE